MVPSAYVPRFNARIDPSKLVLDSIQNGKPMIVVNVNYRLNIFAFGDGNGEKNLALQDQKAAMTFVRDHIRDFDGDPVNIFSVQRMLKN